MNSSWGLKIWPFIFISHWSTVVMVVTQVNRQWVSFKVSIDKQFPFYIVHQLIFFWMLCGRPSQYFLFDDAASTFMSEHYSNILLPVKSYNFYSSIKPCEFDSHTNCRRHKTLANFTSPASPLHFRCFWRVYL